MSAEVFIRLSGNQPKKTVVGFDDALNAQLDGTSHAAEFTHHVFNMARELCLNYEPSQWEICEVACADTFFIYPIAEEGKLFELGDADEPEFIKTVDAKVFGALLSLLAFNEGTDRPASQQATCDLFYNKWIELINIITSSVQDISPHVSEDQSYADEAMSDFFLSYID